MPDQDIYIITKSPPDQYSYSKIKLKETGEKTKHLTEYENAIIVFGDILGLSNSKYIDQFFIRGRHIKLDLFYLSQPYFDLPKSTTRNKSNTIILFNQTIKDKNLNNRSVAGYDMTYYEFEELGRKPWEEEIIFLCIDKSKKKDQGDIVFILKTESLIQNARLKRSVFKTQ